MGGEGGFNKYYFAGDVPFEWTLGEFIALS